MTANPQSKPGRAAAPARAARPDRIITPALIREALHCIPPDVERETWVRLGMAIKAELGPEGFDLWDAWSQNASDYSTAAAKDTWRSIKAGGAVKIGTLFGIAKDHGFRFPDANGVQSSAPPTPEAVAEAARLAERKRVQREAEAANYRHRADEAAKAAAELWAGASEEGSSPYLLRKGVAGYGVRHLADGWLLVPMRNALGELLNVQRIAPAKPTEEQAARGLVEKRFLPGGRKSGLLHWLGDPAGAAVLCMAEGVATAASVHAATGLPVACCFDAGNLVAVAKELRPLYPAAAFLACGDDDTATAERTGKNPGRLAAAQVLRAMKAAGAAAAEVFPDRGCNDFNDLHRAEGLEAVAALVTAAAEALAKVAASPDGVAVQTPAVSGADVDTDTDTDSSPVDPRPEPEPEGSTAARTVKPRQAGKSGAQATGNNVVPLRQRAAKKSGAGLLGGDSDGGGDGGDSAEVWFGDWRVNDGGVWRIARDRNGNKRSDEEGKNLFTWCCGRLDVVGNTRAERRGWGWLVQFKDRDGKPLDMVLASRDLHGQGAEWRKSLADAGLNITMNDNLAQALRQYIQEACPVDVFIRTVARAGWFQNAYVLPGRVIGDPGERVMLRNEGMADHPSGEGGSLELWRNSVARVSAGNSRMVFSISAALAGCLLRVVDTEGGGFHFYGESSKGKSTALYAAASVWGPRSYFRTWKSTAVGLEELFVMHSDGVTCLDEMKEADPKSLQSVIMSLGNGRGKARGRDVGGLKELRDFTTLLLSTGEYPVAKSMALVGLLPDEGAQVRLPSILGVPVGAKFGAFETVHEFAEGCSDSQAGAAMSAYVKQAAAQNYGGAGVAFLEHVAPHFDEVRDEARRYVSEFVKLHCPGYADGQVLRVAQRVGLVAFAGELAGSLGITGWPEEQAHDYAVEVLNSWVSERPGKWGNGERAAALAAVRDWIARHGDMFDDRPGEDRAPNRVDKAGWVYSEFRGLRLDDAVSRGIGPLGPEEEAEVTRIFQVIPAFFDEVICKDVGKAVALSVIRPHIIMKKEKDGKGLERERHDPKTYIKGARITTRVIHIRGSILNDFGEGATG